MPDIEQNKNSIENPTNPQKSEEPKKKKKGGIGAWLYRIIILALVGVMGFSAYNIYEIYDEYEEGTTIYNNFADEVGAGKVNDEVNNSRLKNLDWDALKAKSEDVIAWIRCKDTVLNYPIVQGSKWESAKEYSDYYLMRTITGEYNGKGTLFVDHSCKKPFESFLTIIYGHRMKDGSMFKLLPNYFDESGIEYYNEHPKFELYLPGKDYDLEIFACAKVDETDGTIYKYEFNGTSGKEDSLVKQVYIDRIFEVNQLMADTGVTVSPSDQIVMMSTCTAELDNHRLVVWAKLVPVE